MTNHTTHDPTPHKICTKCGESKPATTDYFSRKKRGKFGLASQCKTCRDEYTRKWRQENQKRVSEYNRAYREENRDRMREYEREHRQAKRDRMRAYRQANRDKRREYNRMWRQANPEARRASWHRYSARKRNAEGTHTAQDIQAQYKAQRGRCYYAACGYSKLGDDFHVDHVIPLSRGGSNDKSNLVIACPGCNVAKGDKLPSDFPQGGRLL